MLAKNIPNSTYIYLKLLTWPMQSLYYIENFVKCEEINGEDKAYIQVFDQIRISSNSF